MKYKAKIRRTCYICNGKGKELVKELSRNDKGYRITDIIKCYQCKGTGKVEEEIEVLEIRPIT